MPEITEKTIRQRSTSKSFERGKSYYWQGAVQDTVKRGDVIEARCEGSQYQPYRVKVTLDKNGNIIQTTCNCEYDFEGDCKHIIALLLTYANNPDVFEERQPLEEIIKERSKEELIILIKEMVNRYPDLEILINRPIPGNISRQTPVNVETFRREIQYAIHHYSGEWGDSSISDAIRSVKNAGKEFADNGDWRSASAIFRAIYDECLTTDTYLDDEEGEFGAALDEIVGELADCLGLGKMAEDDAQRRAIFDSLLQIYIWNTANGGSDTGADAPDIILQHARKEDLPFIREKIIAEKKKLEKQSYQEWAVKNYEAFLLDIDALDNTDPEIILKRLRDNGQYHLLTEKLLTMGRVDEALKTIRKHLPGSFNLLRLMPSLVNYAGEEQALTLAQASLSKDYHAHLASWLIHYAETHHKPDIVLELRLKDFYQPPQYPEKYVKLKSVAVAAGKWDAIYPEMIQYLEKAKNYGLLTQVYLQEKQSAEAWAALALYQKTGSTNQWNLYSPHSLEFEVAKETRYDTPEKSLPIYRQYIRSLIAMRQRDYYAQAAGYLSDVETMYDNMGEYEQWENYINGIKTEFKKLPALMDELKKAGF